METPWTMTLEGRVTLQDVEKTVAEIKQQSPETINITLSKLEEIDVTGIQMIVAMKEKFGDRFTFEMNDVDPNLQNLLASSGVLELLNGFSN